MGVALLRGEGLQRRLAGRLVLDLDEIEVQPGEVLAVLGPNGAGKSTLFRLLLLLERPDGGRVLLDGRPVARRDRDARQRITGVFQRPHLFAGTVLANVEYGLRARHVPRRERRRRALEALGWLGVAALADAPASVLSAGEAQRVALARSLVLEPGILLLDEPAAALDVTIRRRFREDLERLVRTRAGGALLITHDPTDAFALADRIAVMDRGRIVQVGRPHELVLAPATPFVAAFTGAELLLDGVVVGREPGLVSVRVAGRSVVVAAAADMSGRLSEGAPAHVAYRPEDVVLSLPGSTGATSARNRFDLRVAALSPAGGLVRVRLEGEIRLVAQVTRQSAETLELARGREVRAQLKATALRAYPAAARR